jgi:hypothetical protein
MTGIPKLPPANVAILSSDYTPSTTVATGGHWCQPECSDCFRRRVCGEGHDYTDALPVTTAPVGLRVTETRPTLYCRRCGVFA